MSKCYCKCCCEPEPCCEPCYVPCYVPCQTSCGYGGFGGGNLCWIVIVIAIFWVICNKDKDRCFD